MKWASTTHSPAIKTTDTRERQVGPTARGADTHRSTTAPDLAAVDNQTLQRLFGGPRDGVRLGGVDDPEERQAEALARRVTASVPVPVQPPVESARPPGGGGARLVLGAGRVLEPGIRDFFETRLGTGLGRVRLHTGEQAQRAATDLGARAFALGEHVALGAGEYSPGTAPGRLLLAHELAHVALGHKGVRPWTDVELWGRAETAERRRREAEAAAHRHAAWEADVERQFGRELTGQSGTIAEERERIDFALTGQQAAAFDAAAGGQGWLNDALERQGYSDPTVLEVKQRWAGAQVAAELVRAASSAGGVSTESRLHALENIPPFYDALAAIGPAVEQAHRTHVETTNARLRAEYQRERRAYEERERMDRMAYRGVVAEPGAGAFRAGLAVSRGRPPAEPSYLTAPPAVTSVVAPAMRRVNAAETAAEWDQVAADVCRLGARFSGQIVATLPARSEIRTGIEYLTQLDTRLAQFESQHQVAFRIPAVFYPENATVARTDEEGNPQTRPKSIPWQFHLINTGVPTHDQPARAGGEWVLVDLTSTRRYENRAPASDMDSAMLQQGKRVDPPISMFSVLNSRIRFPKGRLYFTLPSGQSYILRTTEPWSLSSFLTALGIALAAVALVAGVIATGGAATPAAIALYAGLASAGVSVGSTLANIHERSQHGILTGRGVDRAAVQIGIDLIGALSLGLGRLVTAPGALARLGSRFVVLNRITQGARVANVAGDVYQAMTVTADFVGAFDALQSQLGLTDDERERMRGQLVRRALLSGAIMTVALRGDIADIRSGRMLRVSGVGRDGALVVQGRYGATRAETDAPRSHVEGPHAPGAGRAAAQAEVNAPVHASAQRTGSGLRVGPQAHAVGVGGAGSRRDLYFCSDLCAPIADRLRAVLAVLPKSHPFRPAVRNMLSSARRAGRRLRSGQLTQQEADEVARELSGRIQRLSNDSSHFAALMNTDPALLAARPHTIRQRLRQALEDRAALLGEPAARQAANRGPNRGRTPLEPTPTRSPIETDILGGIAISDVARASRRQQPIHFDVGNFSHTYAEALVPGLPRGLNSEVPVTLPNGSVGRADRVRFIYDSDGYRIGAHVYEIKPNTADNIAAGATQAQGYVAGLRAEIESKLRSKGKTIPTSTPDGGPLYSGQVLSYDYDRMMAVLRALRVSRRDAGNMAELESIARQVFGAAE